LGIGDSRLGRDLLQAGGVGLVEGDAVVIGQLLAGLDVAGRLDEDAVLANRGLAECASELSLPELVARCQCQGDHAAVGYGPKGRRGRWR